MYCTTEYTSELMADCQKFAPSDSQNIQYLYFICWAVAKVFSKCSKLIHHFHFSPTNVFHYNYGTSIHLEVMVILLTSLTIVRPHAALLQRYNIPQTINKMFKNF